jgi:Protein of unknown function (DUF3467)
MTYETHQRSDYRENYSNVAQVNGSLFDFRICFGVAQPLVEGQTAQLDMFQTIFLSPQHAKSLLGMLTQNVQNYEATFGEIALGSPMPGKPLTTLQ